MPNPPITNADVVTLKAGGSLIISPLSNDVLDPGTAWATDNPVVITTGPNLLYPEQVFPVGSGAPAGGISAPWLINGVAAANERVVKTTPYNTQGVVWEAINVDSVATVEGGGTSQYHPTDSGKTYRYSLWARKQYTGQGNIVVISRGRDSLAAATYSSYLYLGQPPAVGTGIDDWYLFVVHVHESGYAGGTHADTGIYSRSGTKTVGGTDITQPAATVEQNFVFYTLYNTNTPPPTEKVDYFGPRIDLVDGSEPTIAHLIAGTGISSLSHPSSTVVADASTGLVTYTSTGSVPSTDTFYYTATDSNGLVSNETPVTVDITGPESESAPPPGATDITLSSGALLKYRATPLGLGVSVTANPTTVRNKSVRFHLELSGGTGGGSNVTVAVEGRAAAAAPWYRIAEVVGSWQTPSSSQVKANTDGSYAFETVAFPEMRAKLLSFSGGTAVQASSTTSIALLGNPSVGDWLSMDDAFGSTAKFVFYSGTDLPTGDGDIPVLIGVDSAATGVTLLGAIRLEAAKHRINIDAVGGSQDTRIDCTHKVPGTTGNSTSITFSPASGTFFTSPLSGGTGTDTYTSVWLDA